MLHFFCLDMWLRQISSIDHLAVKNALQQDSPAYHCRVWPGEHLFMIDDCSLNLPSMPAESESVNLRETNPTNEPMII